MGKISYEAKLEKAKSQISKSQKEIVETYLTRIKEGYETADEQNRQAILKGLEFLVERICSGTLIIPKNILKFDREQARAIRNYERLTQEDLAEIINPNNIKSAKGTISRYESGKTIPLSGKIAREYVAWLQSHGYQA